MDRLSLCRCEMVRDKAQDARTVNRCNHWHCELRREQSGSARLVEDLQSTVDNVDPWEDVHTSGDTYQGKLLRVSAQEALYISRSSEGQNRWRDTIPLSVSAKVSAGNNRADRQSQAPTTQLQADIERFELLFLVKVSLPASTPLSAKRASGSIAWLWYCWSTVLLKRTAFGLFLLEIMTLQKLLQPHSRFLSLPK